MIICRENIFMEMLEWILYSVYNNIFDVNFFFYCEFKYCSNFWFSCLKGFLIIDNRSICIFIGCYGFFKKKICIKGSVCVYKNVLKYEIYI